jgi:putative transposase
MRSGRPKRQLTINEAERAELSGIARSHSMPAALVLRAKIVLACACEASNQAVADRLALCPHTVGKWRNRFVAERLAGLYDEVRAGRPRTVKDEAVATLISKTLTNKPAAATHWSVRSVAEETGLSKSTVHRLFQLFALQPHRTRSFKISSDPFFVEKLRDIVGLYLNPPDKALVLCVDAKSQVQALERTQPMLPIGLRLCRGRHPRLRASQHYHPVRRAQCARRLGPGAVQAASSPSGISRLSAPHRSPGPARTRHPSRGRQLRHPQAQKGQSLARTTAALAGSLHAHLRLLAQPSRTLLRPDHKQRNTAGILHLRQRSCRQNRRLHQNLQRPTPSPSFGPLPQTPSSTSSSDFVSVFLGQNTSRSERNCAAYRQGIAASGWYQADHRRGDPCYRAENRCRTADEPPDASGDPPEKLIRFELQLLHTRHHSEAALCIGIIEPVSYHDRGRDHARLATGR